MRGLGGRNHGRPTQITNHCTYRHLWDMTHMPHKTCDCVLIGIPYSLHIVYSRLLTLLSSDYDMLMIVLAKVPVSSVHAVV